MTYARKVGRERSKIPLAPYFPPVCHGTVPTPLLRTLVAPSLKLVTFGSVSNCYGNPGTTKIQNRF